MSVQRGNTNDKQGSDPNKGLNVRTFSVAIIVALVVLLAGAILFVRARTGAASPQQNQAPSNQGSHPGTGSSETGHTQTQ